MSNSFKSFLKKIIPNSFILFISKLIPKIQITNTYLLKRDKPIENISPIDSKFYIRPINLDDEDKLRKFYASHSNYNKIIEPRLKGNSWVGIAVIDSTNKKIAYVSWIIIKNINFLSEFKIILNDTQFFMRHGYCLSEYRHMGLHTRMEQERINYCIKNGAKEIFIQIANNNLKGIESVENNGFRHSHWHRDMTCVQGTSD